MSFLNEVKAQATQRETRCSVAKFVDTQPDLTDDDIRRAAAEVNAAAVHRAIKGRGYPFGRQTVERHVNGNCTCPTS